MEMSIGLQVFNYAVSFLEMNFGVLNSEIWYYNHGETADYLSEKQ